MTNHIDQRSTAMICGKLEDKNDMEEDSEEKLFEKILN